MKLKMVTYHPAYLTSIFSVTETLFSITSRGPLLYRSVNNGKGFSNPLKINYAENYDTPFSANTERWYFLHIVHIQFAGSTHHRCLRCPRVWHRPLFLHCVRGTVDQDQQNLPDLQRFETECQKAKLHLSQVSARHHFLYSGRSGRHQCHMVLGLTTRGHSPPPNQRG